MKILKSPILPLLVLAVGMFSGVLRSEDYDEEPIRYSATPADDPVARLIHRLDSGAVKLRWDDHHGWLPSLLEALHIPTSSQVLVFSKTSLQRERIMPERPRALYFNDEVYIGTVQNGSVLEIASTDPRQGTMFYAMPTSREEAPSPRRETQECLQCHDSNAFTGGVPGLMMRSIYPDVDGRPILTAGSYITDQRTPLAQRWGGWYVTGTTADGLHMGNQIFKANVTPESVERKHGSNLMAVADLVDVSPYLTAHSDVVALMVLSHQLQMHNLITRASFETRRALRDDLVMNKALGRRPEFRSETTTRRIASVGEALLRYMVYVDEAPLSGPVRGSSGFAKEFTAKGPRDPQGRSLREFDLQRRLMHYPLSHLIYGEAFDALPPAVHQYVLERLLSLLTTASDEASFAHLSLIDRRAILEILVATKPGLPAGFADALAR